MRQSLKDAMRKVLKKCSTLDEADKQLAKHVAPTPSRAIRWGLFDGLNDRPHTLAGLVAGETEPEVVRDYDEGYRTGREMRR